MRKAKYVTLALTVLLFGCAVRNNPNLTKQTTVELNLTDQITQAQQDYESFFINVGRSKAQGLLTDEDTRLLIKLGYPVKASLEEAASLWKAYQSAPSNAVLTKVLSLVSKAATDYAMIYATRANQIKTNAERKAVSQ